MTSIFSSWVGSNKLAVDVEQPPADPSRNRALSSASNPMSPIDRATSMTPKAPHQFSSQPDWSMSARDHHREASEATLNGQASDNGAPADSPAVVSFPREPSLIRPTASRPQSMAGASDLTHDRLTAFSSTLGGVDSEAAWSATHPESAKNSAPRRRKKIAPPELLVIVKPPPSKQANPLNLQIQLVMPQQLQRREGSQRRSSMDSSAAPAELTPSPSNDLRRRDSITSTRSAGSEISAAGSVASTSSGRRVTPLYNLNFHTILSTTVSDAGTDQKVAKYVRKGIDLDGFGVLEPAELVGGVNDLATLYRNAAAEHGSSTVQGPLASSTSPRNETDSSDSIDEASALSAPTRDNAGSAAGAASGVEPPTSYQAMTPEARGVEANLGGKLLGKFKRFSLNVRPASSSGATSAFGPDSAATQDRATGSGSSNSHNLFGRQPNDPARAPGNHDIPQFSPGAGVVEGKRTEGYYWTVRKWNRRVAHDGGEHGHLVGRTGAAPRAADAQGANPVLASVWKRFNLVNRMGGNEVHPPASQIPVRFEWSRDSRKSRSRRRAEVMQARLRASVSLNASVTSIDRHTGEPARTNGSLHPTTSTSAQSLSVDDAAPRLSSGDVLRSTSRPSSFVSGAGHRSPRRSIDTSAAGSSAPHGDDSGDESDPEDSETPWNCHLVLGPTTRIPLGTLSPAPHHPKLVGQLAVPFPLPDLSSTGLGPDGAGLTREELKDVIIVTCLHLIVRESFGGLARRRSHGSSEAGVGATAASMANVNGWRLASLPKKQ